MRINKSVSILEAYVPGEQPKVKSAIKLNTNENPYPPSPKCGDVLRNFDLDFLRRYPDPVFSDLRKAIAEANGTRPENVFVGNGSDEILTLAARAFVENNESIASLDPSYSLYKTLAAIRDVKWIGSPVEARSPQIPDDVSLFLWTNPNAPTGELTPPAKIVAFAENFSGVVIVDEAYADFAETNCMRLAVSPQNTNLMVMRTFSKSYSLAGMRVGYCVGPVDLIEALYKVKDSYNVDAVAQAVALAAFTDCEYHRECVEKVVKTREFFTEELEKLGWDVIPSQANFVFAKPNCMHAAELFTLLREKNIFVRYFPGELTGERLRITIGTDLEMRELLSVLTPLSRG
jgi:histidinol-phosphate aminotransferase